MDSPKQYLLQSALVTMIALFCLIVGAVGAIMTVEILGPPQTLIGLLAIAIPWAFIVSVVFGVLVLRSTR